jgi:hypothetical protein
VLRLPDGARRVVVAGGPQVGKSTLSERLALQTGFRSRSTDELIDKLGWSEVSAEVAKWLTEPGPWIVEGTASVRAIRKWLVAHETGKPCDMALVLWTPKAKRSPGQVAMAKGVLTVWKQILPQLLERGVKVMYEGSDRVPLSV